MWSNNRPPSTTSPGDHFNNNSAPPNPYSRSASTPKVKQGRQSTDPWDWGWEDTSAQQHDEWNSGWNKTPASVPNVIPNPSPSMYHPAKPEKNAHGTPDLIPERMNNVRGVNMGPLAQPHYNQVSNASEFFENIDLVSPNQQSMPPNMYNAPDPRRMPQHTNLSQQFPMYQPQPPQSDPIRQNMTPASYFQIPQSSQLVQNQQVSYYQQPSVPQTPNMFQNSQYYPPPDGSNQVSTQQFSGNYYEQNTVPVPDRNHYYDQSTAFVGNSEAKYETTSLPGTLEVENIEVPVAPPEGTATPASHSDLSTTHFTPQQSHENNLGSGLPIADENSGPDNQETVPENEEKIQNLPQKLSHLSITSHNTETWSNSPGWENQEVAPRCELDRNQYLETGQLVDSNEAEEVSPEIDNNDEAEALPPPGLHRMVTGQGPESISQRSVLGQLPNTSQNNSSGFVRLVQGQLTPRASPEPTSLERLVPGQHNNEDTPISRTVLGHQSQSSQMLQRFSAHQEPQGEMQRLVTGQVQNESPMGVRMVPGQLSDDENNVNTSDMERMIPGGVSEHESSYPGDVPDDERMVPGGISDDSRSQSISIDDDTRNGSDRLIPGMTEMNHQQMENQNERLVTGAGRLEELDPPPPNSSQDGLRHSLGHRSGTPESAHQPPPGLHRLVLGQMNSDGSGDANHATAKSAERTEAKQGGNPPLGMHRMVVGQFREKEPEPGENDKEKESVKSNGREDDSDSDDRSYRRRHKHRRDSYDDERRERDCSSDREYRGKREERLDYRKKRDNSYNRSPEYRSDHEDYDRNDYRDRRERERDRRDRPRDRDRRRRSPEFNYDPYYRDDPRKLHPRDRERRYYDTYEDDPYYYRENRSRPSSRSGSEYRRQRDYPPRQPYYPDQGGMHYMQMMQYYDNMRRNDPQAYALWYAQYIAQKNSAASTDRASVHSGRSSANDNSQLQENLLHCRKKLLMSTPQNSPVKGILGRSHPNLSLNWSSASIILRVDEEDGDGTKAEDNESHRSTPPLYSSAHIRGQFNMLGQLIVVNPHDPFSYGEHQPTVTLCKIAGPNTADTADTLEFLRNPGPFVSGVTHKNTVLQYLKKQSDQLSYSSEKLLYELIRLVIKLNGVVDMTDVADLLMKSYRSSKTDDKDFSEMSSSTDGTPPLSPHEITTKFRELLLEGNKTEALEWAMINKDWGHALFLASKMDSRTHNNVMLRFANGLQNNDPLQTLYQLMSGREPQAATCAADKKWGDWRPHLAMMLSNRTANLELDRKAILTLGDSLGARGRLFASHFCYLTAQLEFSNYSDRHAKLVLLGSSTDEPFTHFAKCRAIMLTLCYEYAKQLSNKEWCIPTLRPYKFLLACRLFDHGNLTAALAYLECLAQEVTRMPYRDDKPLTRLIVDMADKIKCADSTLAYSTDPSIDPDWLARLKLYNEETNDPSYLPSHLTHGISTSTVSDLEPYNGGENVPQPLTQDVNQTYPPGMPSYATDPHNSGFSHENYYNPSQNNYYNPPQSIEPTELQQTPDYNAEPLATVDNSAQNYWASNSSSAWGQQQQLVDSSNQQQLHVEPVPAADPQPQISVKPGFGYYANSEEDIKPKVESQAAPTQQPENKEKSSRRANKTQQSGPGWFGGIWDKLALRPKNQMKLPDDKNPPIVWDEKTKKWVNTDSSEEEQSAQMKPPPKASELSGATPSATSFTPALNTAGPVHNTSGPSGLPPAPAPSAGTNKYKLQRGKGMRGNYIDVLGSNKKATSSSTNSTQSFAPVPQAAATNFFVPAPVAGIENAPVDFLSPSGPVSYEPTSSKSDDQPPPGGFGKGNPSFFNPRSYQS